MVFYQQSRHGIKSKVSNFNAKAQASYSMLYDHLFGFKAARLWNMLPSHVNKQGTLSGFKEALGAFLKDFPDTPPITGYSTINSNSLLDWSTAENSIVRPG